MPDWNVTGPLNKAISWAERSLYVAVAILLVGMSAFVLVQAIRDLLRLNFQTSLTVDLAVVLNDILFAIIILELLTTVLTHLRKGGFQVKAFLYIGIISSVRRIIVLGAQLSAGGALTETSYRREITELVADAGVVLILALALLIMRWRAARPVAVHKRAEAELTGTS